MENLNSNEYHLDDHFESQKIKYVIIFNNWINNFQINELKINYKL